ncbi:MAG: Tryptophanyl-tRNA synthetase [Parcubacteria group bacterium GW2011_GWA2_47_26]|nr:MAG: Tryptophanyl-tRNA synthetase [Parcubacteria group bacterium GW2011_GWA2_47_26]
MRVFSGIRPSGRLHLGNYLGAIKNWVELQEKHDCIFAIVDYHGITTPFEPETLRQNIKEVALDYLAVGLDPKKAALIQQSQVSEHVELGWIFSSITPVSWLERVPTYKEKIAQHPEYVNLGLLAYPTLMAADILIYKATLVPVGEDQLPHIELANMIGKRFNHMFPERRHSEGAQRPKNPAHKVAGSFASAQDDTFSVTFPPVKALLTEGARVMSLKDPRKKMSKTPPVAHTAQIKPLVQRDGSGQAGDEGCVFLSDPPELVRRKIKTAVTDSGRDIVAREDKPALMNLLTIYSEVSQTPIKKLEKQYAGKGYAEFKAGLAEAIVKFLEPIQARRKELEKKKGCVEEVLAAGAASARPLAQKTLAEVKKKMGLGL